MQDTGELSTPREVVTFYASLSPNFDKAILRIFRHVLTFSFRFNRQFYEQADGSAIFPSSCEILHSVLRRNGSGDGDPLAPLLVSLRGRYVRQLVTWTRQADELPRPPEE